jgi:hypothetical protein
VKRVISWFSCGSASSYATYLALQKYDNVEIVYCKVRQEHPSNEIFLKEFEIKFNVKIKILENEKYQGDIYNVFLKKKFIKNQSGAPCTLHLKKDMRKAYQKQGDIQIFGYTIEEYERMNRFIDANPDVILDNILIDNKIRKKDCLQWLKDMGFELPEMYKLGYSNNNCVGCVKGGKGYWNKIRVDFPDAFEKMATIERIVGHSINTEVKNGVKVPVFLDELKPTAGNFKKDNPQNCGFNCELKF